MDTQTNGAHSDLRRLPDAIPRLKQAYGQALRQVETALADAAGGFRIERPAMMDDASTGFRAAFNGYALEGSGSVLAQVSAFGQRLHKAIDELDAIERAYERNETGTALALNRRLGS